MVFSEKKPETDTWILRTKFPRVSGSDTIYLILKSINTPYIINESEDKLL